MLQSFLVGKDFRLVLATSKTDGIVIQLDSPYFVDPDGSIPLVIDLDGTLCRTDTLHESVFGLVARQPHTLLAFPGWLAGGKASFKHEVAERGILDPALLPYDEDVLHFIEVARREGRPVALVSAADYRQVEAVATHLGIFHLAIGTGSAAERGNLSGKAKADFLVERYGMHGFDYFGDSAADIPVWASARRAYGIRVPARARSSACSQGVELTEIRRRPDFPVSALIRACRPYQWAKNLLILVPVLTAQDLSKFPAALLAMLCFSLTASAIYIVNDLVDLSSDRLHPRKRNRPFASSEVSMIQGLALAAGLLLISSFVAITLLPVEFILILMAYLAVTLAYSFWLKRKMMADVISLAMLYTLRIIAGSMATGIELSPWLLVFSMFLFFALATIKRQAELEDLRGRGSDKAVGRNLVVADLPILQSMSISAAQAAVLVFALYSQDSEVQSHFGSPNLLLLICPVLFFWMGRMQLMTRRGYMTDDPIVFTFQDRVSLLCGLLMLGLFIVAAKGGH